MEGKPNQVDGEVAPPVHTGGIEVPPQAPFFILMNSTSGKHDGEDVRLQIESTLTNHGRRVVIEAADDASSLKTKARDVVKRAKAEGAVVVAAGGDGTINTVAEATLGSGCLFGLIPLGTFNYFSRTHGIPSDVPAACEILLSERAFAVQVGLLNDRVFLVNASLGLYPELLEEREQAKRQLGRSRWVALGAALRTVLRRHRNLRIDLQTRGRRQPMVTPMLFVGNNRLQLERVGISASELVEQHRLIAVMLKPVGALEILKLIFLHAALGRLGEADEVVSFALEALTVRPRNGRRPVKVATDGEVAWIDPPLTFRIAPQPLLLLRPAHVTEDPG
jgi:diacylglycerol kinase family enzyme